MNTTTVTSTRSGEVLEVLPFPADTEPEDIQPGTLWVRDSRGTEFSIRESRTTPGGEFAPAAHQVEEVREDWAAGIVAANVEHDRRENRRSYYLRTGR